MIKVIVLLSVLMPSLVHAGPAACLKVLSRDGSSYAISRQHYAVLKKVVRVMGDFCPLCKAEKFVDGKMRHIVRKHVLSGTKLQDGIRIVRDSHLRAFLLRVKTSYSGIEGMEVYRLSAVAALFLESSPLGAMSDGQRAEIARITSRAYCTADDPCVRVEEGDLFTQVDFAPELLRLARQILH